MPNRLLTLAACLALASCASGSGKAAPPPCAAPVGLPDAALDDQQIEILWGRDRTALRECAARLAVATGRVPQ